MPQLASDDFNRADSGTLGANWTVQSGANDLRIVSNQADADADPCQDYYNAVTWPNNHYSQVTVKTPIGVGGGKGFGPSIRLSSIANTGYHSLGNDAGTDLYLAVAGVYTLLGHSGTVVVNNDVLYLEGNGTAVVLKLNTVTKISVVDATIAAGNAGLIGAISSGEPKGDNWSGGSLTQPSGDTLLSSRGNVTDAGAPGVTGALLLSSRGDFVEAGTPGVSGIPSMSSRGDFVSSSKEGVNGDVGLSSRGNAESAGGVSMSGDSLNSYRGDLVASGGPGNTGSAFLSSRGDVEASGNVAVVGDAEAFSRGDAVFDGAPSILGDMALSSRGNFEAVGVSGIGGAAILSSRGNFSVIGSIDPQDPFACRPGNIRERIMKAPTQRPYAYVKFRNRRKSW